MRYFLIFSVLVISITLTKEATDKICLDESDQNLCESFGLQCGVTIRVTNRCGKTHEAMCICRGEESCNSRNFNCQ